ncbi:MAG: DUF11 domain-containing protein [Patescibacteria group bacterium]|nr:DUF11 domain-containing protein [Patescibacteria group bacterium]
MPWLDIGIDVNNSNPNRGEVFNYIITAKNDGTQGLSYILSSQFDNAIIPYEAYTNDSGSCQIEKQLITCAISHSRRKDVQITIRAFISPNASPGSQIDVKFEAQELYGRKASSNVFSVIAGSGFVDPPQMQTDIDSVSSLCSNDEGIFTSLGCLPLLRGGVIGLVSVFLLVSAGIGGGIVMILIIVAGYMIMSSTGEPRKLQAGKELIAASIAGVLMLLFSVVILRLIASDLVRIF